MSSDKEKAIEGVEAIIRILERVYGALAGSYTVRNRQVTILCGSNSQKTSLVIEAKPGILHQKKITFRTGVPNNIEIRSLTSSANLSNCIKRLDDGFEILTERMNQEDLVLLDLEYPLDTPGFIKAIVDSTSTKESPKGEESEFWLHAQLRYPVVLAQKYSKFDIKELEVVVRVPVSNYISLSIPASFKAEMDALYEFTNSKNPHEDIVRAINYTKLKRRRSGKNYQQVLAEMQGLFVSNTFRTFLDVPASFEYHDSIKGSSYYDSIPFPTYPKFMEVITRTDLSLDRFAAEGTLKFKRDMFTDEIVKIVGEEKKRKVLPKGIPKR